MKFLSKKTNTYKALLEGNDGKFLLAALLDFTGFYKQSFSPDPYTTAFNEGRRSVALHLIQILNLREDEIRKMVESYRYEMFNSMEN